MRGRRARRRVDERRSFHEMQITKQKNRVPIDWRRRPVPGPTPTKEATGNGAPAPSQKKRKKNRRRQMTRRRPLRKPANTKPTRWLVPSNSQVLRCFRVIGLGDSSFSFSFSAWKCPCGRVQGLMSVTRSPVGRAAPARGIIPHDKRSVAAGRRIVFGRLPLVGSAAFGLFRARLASLFFY